MARRCVTCGEAIIDKETGAPVYNRFHCGDVCRARDKREKLAAKRMKERQKFSLAVARELKRRSAAEPIVLIESQKDATRVTTLSAEVAELIKTRCPEIEIKFRVSSVELPKAKTTAETPRRKAKTAGAGRK